jgi:hypothetical protein
MLCIKGAIWIDSCYVLPEQQPWLQQCDKKYNAELQGQLTPPFCTQYSKREAIHNQHEHLRAIDTPSQLWPMRAGVPQH